MGYIAVSLILSLLLRSMFLSCCQLEYSVDVCKGFSCALNSYASALIGLVRNQMMRKPLILGSQEVVPPFTLHEVCRLT